VGTDSPALGGLLAGYTVLDLGSVGPAARTSRWLADYGATIVKVGPTPKDGAVQIDPVFHSYGGHRGMKRARLDLKDPSGREAFLRLAEQADVVITQSEPVHDARPEALDHDVSTLGEAQERAAPGVGLEIE